MERRKLSNRARDRLAIDRAFNGWVSERYEQIKSQLDPRMADVITDVRLLKWFSIAMATNDRVARFFTLADHVVLARQLMAEYMKRRHRTPAYLYLEFPRKFLEQAVKDRLDDVKRSWPDEIKRLKAAMIAAHPDKGGSSEAFIVAREAYEIARKLGPDYG